MARPKIGPVTRYVRTAEGADFYGVPIGSPIKPDLIKQKNREAATLGLTPPKGAVADASGQIDKSAEQARPVPKVGAPKADGPSKFKVGENEYGVPEGSRIFQPKGKPGMRYVMEPDGTIRAFNAQGEAEVPQNLADKLSGMLESDDRYEEVEFDGASDSSEPSDSVKATMFRRDGEFVVSQGPTSNEYFPTEAQAQARLDELNGSSSSEKPERSSSPIVYRLDGEWNVDEGPGTNRTFETEEEARAYANSRVPGSGDASAGGASQKPAPKKPATKPAPKKPTTAGPKRPIMYRAEGAFFVTDGVNPGAREFPTEVEAQAYLDEISGKQKTAPSVEPVIYRLDGEWNVSEGPGKNQTFDTEEEARAYFDSRIASPGSEEREESAALPPVPERVEDVEGYLSLEQIEERLRRASTDLGSSALDRLEERLLKSNEMIRARWERERAAQAAAEFDDTIIAVAEPTGRWMSRDVAIRLRLDDQERRTVPGAVFSLDPRWALVKNSLEANNKWEAGYTLYHVPTGLAVRSERLKRDLTPYAAAFSKIGPLSIDEPGIDHTQSQHKPALKAMRDAMFSVATGAPAAGTEQGGTTEPPARPDLQPGDAATADFIRGAAAGDQVTYYPTEAGFISTDWTKQEDGSWTSPNGGSLDEQEMISSLTDNVLVTSPGKVSAERFYPGAPEMDRADLQAAYDSLNAHPGFQIAYGLPQGSPLRDREVIGALTTAARAKYPDISPKQAVLAHMRDFLGIQTEAPEDAPEPDGPQITVGAAEPKRTGVQGMNGGAFSRADIVEAVDILEQFQGKAFKSELNKKGNALGTLDPSSIVGIEKDKTIAKQKFVDYLKGILDANPEGTPEAEGGSEEGQTESVAARAFRTGDLAELEDTILQEFRAGNGLPQDFSIQIEESSVNVTGRALGIVGSELRVKGRIFFRGEDVGYFDRSYGKGLNGPAVLHREIAIAEQVRGRGFGQAFDEMSTELYRDLGFSEILTTAMTDGAYVWARAGYEWNENAGISLASKEMMASHLRAKMMKIKYPTTPLDGASPNLTPELQERIESIILVLDAGRTPDMAAIASMTDPNVPNLGRFLLTGSTWPARKSLRGEAPGGQPGPVAEDGPTTRTPEELVGQSPETLAEVQGLPVGARIQFLGVTYFRGADSAWWMLNGGPDDRTTFTDQEIASALRGVTVLRVDTSLDQALNRVPNASIEELRVGESIVARNRMGTQVWTRVPDLDGERVWSSLDGSLYSGDNMPEVLLAYDQAFENSLTTTWYFRRDPQAPENAPEPELTFPGTDFPRPPAPVSITATNVPGRYQVGDLPDRSWMQSAPVGSAIWASTGFDGDDRAHTWLKSSEGVWRNEEGTVRGASLFRSEDFSGIDKILRVGTGQPAPEEEERKFLGTNFTYPENMTPPYSPSQDRVGGRPTRQWVRENAPDGSVIRVRGIRGDETLYVRTEGVWRDEQGKLGNFYDLAMSTTRSDTTILRVGDGSPAPEPETAPEEPEVEPRDFTVGEEIGSADLGALPIGARIGYTRKDGKVTYYTKGVGDTYTTDRGTEVEITGWARARFTVATLPTGVPETGAPETDAPEGGAPETEGPETGTPETEAPLGAPIRGISDVADGEVVQVTLNVDGSRDTLGYEGTGWKAGETRYLRKRKYGGAWETSDAQGFDMEYEGQYGKVKSAYSDSELVWMMNNGRVTKEFDPGEVDPRKVREDAIVALSQQNSLRGKMFEAEFYDGTREVIRNTVDGAWLRPNGQTVQQGIVLAMAKDGRIREPEAGTTWQEPKSAVKSLEQITALRVGASLVDNYQGLEYTRQPDGMWAREQGGVAFDRFSNQEIWERVSRYEKPGGWQITYAPRDPDSEEKFVAGDTILARQVNELPAGSIIDENGQFSVIVDDETIMTLRPGYSPWNGSGLTSKFHTSTPSRDVRVVRVGSGEVPGTTVPAVGEDFDITDIPRMFSFPMGTRFEGPRFAQYVRASGPSGSEDTTYRVVADGVLVDEKDNSVLSFAQFSNTPMVRNGERLPNPRILESREPDPNTISSIEDLRGAPIGTSFSRQGSYVVKVGEDKYYISGTLRNGALSAAGVISLHGVLAVEEDGLPAGVPGAIDFDDQAQIDALPADSLVYDAASPELAWIKNADGTWFSSLAEGPPVFSLTLRLVPQSALPKNTREPALLAQVLAPRTGMRVRVEDGTGKKASYDFTGKSWKKAGNSKFGGLSKSQMAAFTAAGRVRILSPGEDGTKTIAGVDFSNDEQFWAAFKELSDEASIEAFAKRRLPKVNWVEFRLSSTMKRDEREGALALYRDYMGSTIQFFEHYPELQEVGSVGGVRDKKYNALAYVTSGTAGLQNAGMRFNISDTQEGLRRNYSDSNFHVSDARADISPAMRTVIHESGHLFDSKTRMVLGERARKALEDYLAPLSREERRHVRTQFGTYAHTNRKELVAVSFELWHSSDEVGPAVEAVMAAIEDEYRTLTSSPDFKFRKIEGSSFDEKGLIPQRTQTPVSTLITAYSPTPVGDPVRTYEAAYLTGTLARFDDKFYELGNEEWYELDPGSGQRIPDSSTLSGFRSRPQVRSIGGQDTTPNSEILRVGFGYSENDPIAFIPNTPGKQSSAPRNQILDGAAVGSTITADGVLYTKRADGFWYSETGNRVSRAGLMQRISRERIPDEGTSYAPVERSEIRIENLLFDDYEFPSILDVLNEYQNRG